MAIPTGPLGAWHVPGGGGPTDSGVTDLGAGEFSVSQTFLHPNGYKSCIIGNFEGIVAPLVPGVPNPGHALEQHWRVLSRGVDTADGTHFINVEIGATAVNIVEEAGKVVATAIDEDFATLGPKSVEVPHPTTFNGDTAFTQLVLRVRSGVAYDLVIENVAQPPPPDKDPLRTAKHYKIGGEQGFVEVGYGAPTLEYREPGPNSDAFNVGPFETVLLVSSGDEGSFIGPGVTDPAVSITFQVFDPITQIDVVPKTTVDRFPGNLFTDPVSIAFTNDGTHRTLVLATDASGHYKLVKESGPDHGIYPQDCDQPPQPPPTDARTIGFWKNHSDLIVPLLDIGLGDTLVNDEDQAVGILDNSSAKDASNALRAQLLATILNRKNGAKFDAAAPAIPDIRPIVLAARDFLNAHIGDPVIRRHEDRQDALELKTVLDAFNNSGEE